MGRTQTIGKQGENLAAQFLEQQGFQILERNYTYQHAEIDLIARRDDLLVFVEVRLRTNIRFGFPEQTINKKKIQSLRRAAEQYIYHTNWLQDIRFDVVAIHYENQTPQITHIEDAFG